MHRPFSRSRRPLLWLLLLTLTLTTTTGCTWFQNRDWPRFWKSKDSEIILDPSILPINPSSDLPQPISLDDRGEVPPGAELTLPQPNRPVNPEEAAQAPMVNELQTIHFPYNSYEITPEEMAKLESNARWIQEHPGITIQIEGHCDERGTNEYNMNLGQRRADAIREQLYRLGVDPSMLTTISWGEERPLDPGSGEEAWARNRRAQFLIY